MGSMTELFGFSPRVAVLEAFAESPELEFSVPEIVTQTGVSKRGVYMHVRRLLEDGVLRQSSKKGKCLYYRLNEDDKRGRLLPLVDSVITLGRLEADMKRDEEDLVEVASSPASRRRAHVAVRAKAFRARGPPRPRGSRGPRTRV